MSVLRSCDASLRATLGATCIAMLAFTACGKAPSVAELSSQDDPDNLVIDSTSRIRELSDWEPEIQGYSLRHYHEDTADLAPIAIVLHFTAGGSFPWNLIDETSYNGETPGRATHYVVDGEKIWQLLPPTVRSRGAKGANHRAINIEMVALNESDLYNRRRGTLNSAVALTTHLMQEFGISWSEVRSHEEIDRFDGQVPWVVDYVDPRGSGKDDPGRRNMDYIKARLPRDSQS